MKRGNVFCPLYDKEIYEGDCFEISITAERMGSKSLYKQLSEEHEDFENTCMNCPNHKD